MRRVTRGAVVAILLVIALLLALGALPSYLQSGDPYYLTATETGENRTSANASAVLSSRFPYAQAALADAATDGSGRSEAYYRGPLGLKGSFTHSPFDEIDAVRQRAPTAVADDGTAVYLRSNGTLYRLEVSQEV